LREKISETLRKKGHLSPELLTKELNPIIRGWTNYFRIPDVSYPAKSIKKLMWYLNFKITRYYKRKSQRKCKLYNRGAFDILLNRYGLYNPTKQQRLTTL
jgi:hypothetical protein